MPTSVEKRIIQSRRAEGVLVPLLEELLEGQVEPEDEEDVRFMTELLRLRMVPREKGVFSPSMLGSCVRQAYFAKTQFERREVASPRTNAFFLDGNFRHYKWQFALWKLHRAGYIKLLGVELRCYSQSGDFAGTIDALVEVDGKVYIVDFKGMNVQEYMQFIRYGMKIEYGVQIVGYSMLKILKKGRMPEVDGCLLIGESKAGPVQSSSPIGLHEQLMKPTEKKAEVKKRLLQLRRFVENEEVPPPACVSTRHLQFEECPFSWFCRQEVREIQQRRERAARSNPKKRSVATPTREGDDRAGRIARRREARTA